MTPEHLAASPRVVLVGGSGGAGTSGAVAALADTLAGQGVRVAVADLDPWHGAGARTTDPGVRRLPVRLDRHAQAFSRLLDRVGLDPRLAVEAADLPGADIVGMVELLGTVRERDDLDLLLVDLGSRLLEVVGFAHRLPWTAVHLLRAQHGWLRATRPRTAPWMSWWPGADGHRTVREVVERTATWAQAVGSAEALLVGAAQDPRVRRLQLGSDLLELPRPEPVEARSIATWQDLRCPERPEPASLTAEHGGWVWRLGLADLRSSELRVDRSGDDLAVEVLGVRRLVSLPSALRRFPATTARLSGGRLEITFGLEERST